MIRTALKTIFAHKVRLLLTAMSVMIGVAFIAGTFIFTDTINQTFSDLFEDTFAGQDVIVQGEAEFDVGFGGPPPIDESVLDIVLGVDGVAAAEGGVTGLPSSMTTTARPSCPKDHRRSASPGKRTSGCAATW